MPEIDDMGDWMQVWECEAPAKGSKFRVLEDEWDTTTEPPTRIIRRAELISVGPVADEPDPAAGVYPIIRRPGD